MSKKLILIIKLLTILFLTLAFSSGMISLPNLFGDKKLTIIVGESSFKPNELTIKVGQTVTFKTDTDNHFWPASNNHPDHSLYSAFDSGKPIEPNQSWSFTFDQPGVWGFHDHLRPFLKGKIVVTDQKGTGAALDCLNQLNGESVTVKQACWEEVLTKALENDGAKESFKLFTKLYESDQEFASSGCHWYSHKIGDTAYAEYLKHKDFGKVEFPAESVYCGYGYYHGFLEHYLRDNPDLDNAHQICEDLIANRSDDLPRIRFNCYHAIGHGFVPEPTDIGLWGDPQSLIEPGLEACRTLGEKDIRQECMQGAFNVITDWIWNNQYGLFPDEDDPLWLCRNQAGEEEESACYYELSMKLDIYSGGNIVDTYSRYVSDIGSEEISKTIIISAAAGIMQRAVVEDDHTHFIYECRSLPETFRKSCLIGIIGGFMAHGEPTREYIKSLSFCRLNELSPTEKETCYDTMLRTFKEVYRKEKVADLCKDIDPNYQKYCSYDWDHYSQPATN
jgi:plastocyanin